MSEFTPAMIAAYLGVDVDEDDVTIGSIDTCVAIIGRYELGDPERIPQLVTAALGSILEWADDYGARIVPAIVAEDGPDNAWVRLWSRIGGGSPDEAIVDQAFDEVDFPHDGDDDAARGWANVLVTAWELGYWYANRELLPQSLFIDELVEAAGGDKLDHDTRYQLVTHGHRGWVTGMNERHNPTPTTE